jgi:Xaa-Pro aminopeptidase
MSEAVGVHYDRQRMLDARAASLAAVDAIAGRMTPGMLEDDAQTVVREVLAGMGLARGWHAPYVRFGVNTALTYGQPSAPGTRLGEDDIFFVDIGPVMDRWEGDAGTTFTTGGDPEFNRCAADVRAIWNEVRDAWRAGATGAALYDLAAERTAARGWVLNLDLAGHRIGDFPHKAIHKGTLAAWGERPAPDLWVLEVQIARADGAFGAFHEDMLLDD